MNFGGRRKLTSRKLDFKESVLKNLNIKTILEKKKRVKKEGLFWSLFYLIIPFKEDKPETEINESEEEIILPKFIKSKSIANNKKLYENDYNLKDIKRIYKRIINPTDPEFIDIITCSPVERISKMRVNCLYKMYL